MSRRSRSTSRSPAFDRHGRIKLSHSSRSYSPDSVALDNENANVEQEVDEENGYRVHVADLGVDCSKREIEKTFEAFGTVVEVWMARNPPCFAFVKFKHYEDAEEAIKQVDGK